MNFKRVFFIIKYRFSLICLITLFSVLISSIITFFLIVPMYESKLSILIGDNTSDISGQSYDKFTLNKNLVETYGEFSKTNIIAQDVIEKSNLDISTNDLISMIDYEIDPLTQFLTITVTSEDQVQSATINTQLAKSLKKITAIITKSDNVSIINYAIVSTKPSNLNPLINIIISLLSGIMISIFIIITLEVLDNNIKSESDLISLLNCPVIGLIPLETN